MYVVNYCEQICNYQVNDSENSSCPVRAYTQVSRVIVVYDLKTD